MTAELCAGPKGTGKTFQTELAYKKMNMEAVVMSAGVPRGAPMHVVCL